MFINWKIALILLCVDLATASDAVGTLIDGIENKNVHKMSPDKGHAFSIYQDVLVPLPVDKKYTQAYLSGFSYGYMDGVLASAHCRPRLNNNLVQDWMNGWQVGWEQGNRDRFRIY